MIKNILNVLKKLKSVFTGVYLHYENMSELESNPKFEENIAEKTKLRKQRFDAIDKKEKIIRSKLFEKYFGYSSPSDTYKALIETTGSEENKAQLTW